jgi:Ca2+/Na+ antiporter
MKKRKEDAQNKGFNGNPWHKKYWMVITGIMVILFTCFIFYYITILNNIYTLNIISVGVFLVIIVIELVITIYKEINHRKHDNYYE